MIEVLNEDRMFEIANIPKKDSGLGETIWIDSSGSRRNVSHNDPRIKVGDMGNLVPISISQNPRILVDGKKIKNKKKIFKFIVDNYKTLMDHWNGKLSDFEALTLLYQYIKDNR